MHTLKKQSANEFYVGRLQICERGGEEEFIEMFKGLCLIDAIKLVNVLNGGNYNIDADEAKTLSYCLVK